MIDEYGNVKICDFKKSLKISTINANLIKSNKKAMTPCYTAPELFQEDGIFSFKSDLWALGCIMYELAVGHVPFFDDSIKKLITKIINDDINFNKKELRNYSDDFINILKKLLVKEPNERSTWGDIDRMPWWDGYFDNSENFLNNKNDSFLNNNKTESNIKEIDPLKLSKIAENNKRDENQDYNNDKEDLIVSIDQEFEFISKDLDDLNDNLISNSISSNKINDINPMTQSKFLIKMTVFNNSKVFKRDKRYNDINSEIKSNDILPKIEDCVFHQTDKIIKPIIGNKTIEENELTSYYICELPFTPQKKDVLKEMINREKDLKNVEKYLYEIYTVLEQYADKNEFDNLINLLKYFETIVFDRELANIMINSSFIQQFIKIWKNVDNEQVRTICCCIIGYLVRYATIIEVPLDNYGFCEIICHIIKNSNDNSDLIKKASATIGEYLFYVATQEETPENKEWNIQKQYLNILLYCLDIPRNEIVKFYIIKAIENICILTKVSKDYFASKNDYILKILNVYIYSNNPELKLSAISTVSLLLRHNPSLITLFLEKFSILKDKNLYEKEPDGIKQCLINCLLYPIVENSRNLIYIIPRSELFIQTLLSFFEKCSNVIKIKTILLLWFLMIEPNIILKFGEEILIKVKDLRKDKNKEIHLSIKIFEKLVSSNSPTIIKIYTSFLNRDKTNDIITYCKILDIIGLYHKISRFFFSSELLDSIKKYITKKLSISRNNNELIGHLLDVLIKFSENPFSIEENIDIIIKGFLVELLQLTPQIKEEDNLSKIILICSNIFSIILYYDKFYSIDNNKDTKTQEIRALISNLMPYLKSLLQNKDTAESILSLLNLIIESDEYFISLYLSNGIIDYIFTILKNNEYSDNLNIIKILINLTSSKYIQFKEILSMGLIDKVNYLIEKFITNNNITQNTYNDNNDDENTYFNYVFELFYDMMIKINEFKKINYPRGTKINFDSYTKDFKSKIELVGQQFNLCIKLLGNQKNVDIQEMSCVCLIFILQFFFNLELKFKNSDIPYLLKGLKLSCNKIHKKVFLFLNGSLIFKKMVIKY